MYGLGGSHSNAGYSRASSGPFLAFEEACLSSGIRPYNMRGYRYQRHKHLLAQECVIIRRLYGTAGVLAQRIELLRPYDYDIQQPNLPQGSYRGTLGGIDGI